jgi:hypothetical protein
MTRLHYCLTCHHALASVIEAARHIIGGCLVESIPS